MKSAETYREMAAQCRQMAATTPRYHNALLALAETWEQLAAMREKQGLTSVPIVQHHCDKTKHDGDTENHA